jgi:hypothetical protein
MLINSGLTLEEEVVIIIVAIVHFLLRFKYFNNILIITFKSLYSHSCLNINKTTLTLRCILFEIILFHNLIYVRVVIAYTQLASHYLMCLCQLNLV